MLLTEYKQTYKNLQDSLSKDFVKGVSVYDLMLKRSSVIDNTIVKAFKEFAIDDDTCLVAVGGYGREELCLYSDIDLLILIPKDSHDKQQDKIASFLSFLWDIGLEVGSSVRDINDIKEYVTDIVIATNMLEARYLFGDKKLFNNIDNILKNSVWNAQSFFVAKQKELQLRHKYYKKAEYGLEPNLKECQGGLRDIQNILWITKYCFDTNSLSVLLSTNFLTNDEFNILQDGQKFLWNLRFALHIIKNRRYDRISFEVQKKLADLLGYVDTDKLAIEQLMHNFYKTIQNIDRISDILLQLLKRDILHTQTLNSRFVIREGYLKSNIDNLFQKHSYALLEVFLLVSANNYIKGIDAYLLRDIQTNLHLIDDDFRNNKDNAKMFMTILRSKQGVNYALNLMSKYGFLGVYIPVFGKIEGLMQYNLFHKFTVDKHTLFVVRNLRRFFLEEHKKEFLLCHNITKDIAKPELLVLAGLFHDVAKGRGGNHSELGALDADNFCKTMGLADYDRQLVSWLVKQHLLMSDTAQKQNISDFEVLEKFAEIIATVERLNYLYLLTVADIRATDKELWNEWRASLLSQLYDNTKKILEQGLANFNTTNELITKIKANVLISLQNIGFDTENILNVLQTLPEDYFIRHSTDEMIYHYKLIHNNHDKTIVNFFIDNKNKVDIFIHTDDKKCVFFQMIIVLERLNLDVVSAKIVTSNSKKTFNSFTINNDKVLDLENVKQQLLQQIDNKPNLDNVVISDKQKNHKHFSLDTTIKTSVHHNKKYTVLEITSINRAGILSVIANILCKLDILLIDARVATFSERVEDIFFVVDINNNTLDTKLTKLLKQQLLKVL